MTRSSCVREPAVLRPEGSRRSLKKERTKIVFARRKSFIEAGDLAYINSTYKLVDKSGAETEEGNFVQVWKLIGGKWKIVADVFVPLPAKAK